MRSKGLVWATRGRPVPEEEVTRKTSSLRKGSAGLKHKKELVDMHHFTKQGL
jgi:hypothetical protein